jgi:transcription factor SPN1
LIVSHPLIIAYLIVSTSRSALAQSIMDNNLLEGVRRWLEPLPDRSLPALNIQTFFFEQLIKMYIDTNSLKESGLGRIVLFYTKCTRVHQPIARMAATLVTAWSRPIIKRSASARDKVIPIAEQGELVRGPRLNTILARPQLDESGRVREQRNKSVVAIPSQAGFREYRMAPKMEQGLVKNVASVSNDIERRKRTAERMRMFMKNAPKKV